MTQDKSQPDSEMLVRQYTGTNPSSRQEGCDRITSVEVFAIADFVDWLHSLYAVSAMRQKDETPHKAQPDFASDFFDNHAWAAGTMGDLLTFLVDGGSKDMAIYRILADEPEGPDGHYIRRMEVLLVPAQRMTEIMQREGCDSASLKLRLCLEAGLAK